MRVAGLVAYNGAGFQGFQRQTHAPTIQGALERALQACASGAKRVVAAGRTDTGVHASGQVIAAEVNWRHGPDALRRAWNAHLPRSIAIRSLREVPAEFHPRHDALARTYQYHVVDQEDRDAVDRWPPAAGVAWCLSKRLDVDSMNAVADTLLGTRDFGGFGRAPDGGPTVRTLLEARWRDRGRVTDDLQGSGLRSVTFRVTANAFLYRMVRRLTATLVRVGCHEWNDADVQRILDAGTAEACPPPAPAHGLVLCAVAYATPYSDLWEAERE